MQHVRQVSSQFLLNSKKSLSDSSKQLEKSLTSAPPPSKLDYDRDLHDVATFHKMSIQRSQSLASSRKLLKKSSPQIRKHSNATRTEVSKDLIRHLDSPWVDPRHHVDNTHSLRTTPFSITEFETSTAVDHEVESGFAKGEPKTISEMERSTMTAHRPPSALPDDDSDPEEDPFFYDRVLQGFPSTPKFLPSAPGLYQSPRRQPVLRRATTVTSFSYPTNIAYPDEHGRQGEDSTVATPQLRRRRHWLGNLISRPNGTSNSLQS